MSWAEPRDAEEQALMASFEANFERLREESGRSLTPFIKESARVQVILYYRRLRALAEKVAETEVRLVLPEQRSPAGRRYTLEGVVDIVEDGAASVMYDLKTYLDASAAAEHIDPHYRQLNVYAHIWEGVRGQTLDRIALIATRPTARLRQALRRGDPTRLEAELDAWQPVLDVPVSQSVVAEVIENFGAVVDQIEDRRFGPPPLDALRQAARPGGSSSFGQDVCRNCDGRFGCASYRQLQRADAPGRADLALQAAVNDFGGDAERDDWRDGGLLHRPRVDLDPGDV